ncbi:hypothetical protein [Aquimarina aggregata]|uniref:hypothetical protein n=1 Tax=Aquimarina aggregata TaxID=1642818 RepID=UPI00248FE61F|nr:hypothetical protein [Aquimarina aggregata]
MEEQLSTFFTNLKTLSNIAIARSTKLNNDSREHIENLIKNTFNSFEDRNSVQIITTAFLEEELNEQFITDLFLLELRFFNTQYSLNVDDQSTSDITVKDGLKNGKTIKDSLEKLLKKFIALIPKWLEKALDIINEILGITRTLL